MKVIGVTGGIGSGKSTITEILKTDYQAFLLNMDKIAHKLMEKGQVSYELIHNYFGDAVLRENGEIDRGKLGSIVYQDKDKLLKLNSFTHPYVLDYVRLIIAQKRQENTTIICVETALPLQAGLSGFCDEIWYVFAPDEVRRERLKRDRQYEEEKIDRIFKNQISDEDYRKNSTHVLINDGQLGKIREQIEVLLEKNSDL